MCGPGEKRPPQTSVGEPALVNHCRNRRKKNKAREFWVALARNTQNPARRRSNRQRNQHHKSTEANSDEWALGDVLEHSRKIKRLVGPEVGEEVQGNVEKGEKSEHAAEADEVGEFEEFAEGRDAKGEDQKPQRPIAGGVLQEFNGIRTEIAFDDTPD